MCQSELRVLYDAEEGFTMIGKPRDEAFLQSVKETLVNKQGTSKDHFKRVLIAQDPEEPKVYCMIVQHENRLHTAAQDDNKH